MKTDNLISFSSKPHAVIEVFKTNLHDEISVFEISAELTRLFPGYKVNFDLDGCDSILRVEAATNIAVSEIIRMVKKLGFQIMILDD